jgi:hypothetical protein
MGNDKTGKYRMGKKGNAKMSKVPKMPKIIVSLHPVDLKI